MMEKTVFEIKHMDCAAEEQMIRMQLSSHTTIELLDFDLANRLLTVYHHEKPSQLANSIEQLDLGMQQLSTQLVKHRPEQDEMQQRKLLWAVLIINFGFFIGEFLYGFISNSMGLVADSLDMLADAIVYGVSLLAAGSTTLKKAKIAKWSGYLQMGLAILGLTEVLRRFFGAEALPDFRIMISVSALALFGNALSLYLLQRSDNQEAHMQASMIFTSNDVIINIGVILAGALVFWTNSRIPDLIIGSIVFVIVMRGAQRILKLAQ